MLLKKLNRHARLEPSIFKPMERFFANDFLELWNAETVKTLPAINTYSDSEGYRIEMAAPGLKKEDFIIDLEENVLTISCNKKSEAEERIYTDNFSRIEYNYAKFSRAVTLPPDIHDEEVIANYVDGILRLFVPKTAQQKGGGPFTIPVE